MTARDRMEELGAEALSEAELLGLLLGGPSREQPLLAAQLLEGGLPRLARLRPGSQAWLPGLRRDHCERLCVAFELGRRAVRSALERPRHVHAGTLCQALAVRIAHLEWEEFWAVLLTARLEEVRFVRISMGGIAHCSILPREAFAPALLHATPCVVFAHNHPSGDPAPSPRDSQLQLMLEEGARALGVRVVDHLVISQRGHHSAREGYLSFEGNPIAEPPDATGADWLGSSNVFTEVQ